MNRIEKIKKFLIANPTDDFLRHALALEYVKLGNNKEARELFEAILNGSPDYIGSYYHLAKLLEQFDETSLAINWYEKGMAISKKLGDNHAYNELQSAYEELTF